MKVAIRIDSNRELYVSTVYCPHANPSVELIDGLCENRDQIILTGDFNSKHPELGNDQTKPSGTRLVTATQNNNLTLIISYQVGEGRCQRPHFHLAINHP